MPSQRTIFLIITLFVITVVSLVTVIVSEKKEAVYKPGENAENDRAVNKAIEIYEEKKALGHDFSSGPCLTNDLIPQWVADIVHNPKEEADALEKNQCQALLEGRAKHFVELDIYGNIVRVK
jgi:hypothetical protein